MLTAKSAWSTAAPSKAVLIPALQNVHGYTGKWQQFLAKIGLAAKSSQNPQTPLRKTTTTKMFGMASWKCFGFEQQEYVDAISLYVSNPKTKSSASV